MGMQLIESRVSTFRFSAIECLRRALYRVIDDVDENVTITPLIYESDTSDEADEEEEEPDGALDGVSDFDGIEDTSE
ncbi:hypothetical protein EV1_014404 [Malus domestica]